MPRRRKKENELQRDLKHDSWMYTLLLISIVILAESLKGYRFILYGIELTYSLFILPFIFLLTNYITKKYSFTTSICAISLSGVGMVLYYVIMNLLLGNNIHLINIAGEFCGYVIAQFINLNIYVFILSNTTSPRLLIYLSYLFSFITMYMFYTLINLNVLVTRAYWIGYFMTIIIQMIELIPIAIIDKNIKRGLAKR